MSEKNWMDEFINFARLNRGDSYLFWFHDPISVDGVEQFKNNLAALGINVMLAVGKNIPTIYKLSTVEAQAPPALMTTVQPVVLVPKKNQDNRRAIN